MKIGADVAADPLQHSGVLGGGWELVIDEEVKLAGGLFCVIAMDLVEVLALVHLLLVLSYFGHGLIGSKSVNPRNQNQRSFIEAHPGDLSAGLSRDHSQSHWPCFTIKTLPFSAKLGRVHSDLGRCQLTDHVPPLSSGDSGRQRLRPPSSDTRGP